MDQENPSVLYREPSASPSPFSQVFPGARDFEVQGSQFVVVHGNMMHQMAPSPTVLGPPQGLQTPQMMVPNVASPEAAVYSESGNYSSQLLRQGRGFPLYVPGPQINLAAEYRRTGVAIGDVGRVTPEGSFDFFFNIYLPANHPINANIPEDFVPLKPYNPVDVAHHEFDPGNYVSSSSVHKANDDFPEFPGGEFAFNCGGLNGAVLALPYGAHLEKLENLESMRRYAMKHAESWYKYVNGARGRGLVNGDLYLVTGCEKAKSWGMASFHDVPLHKEFQLSFRPTTDEDNGYRYRWQGTHSHYKHSDSPPVDETPLNQTTFIHVFAISVSEGIWGRLFGTETCHLVNSSTFLDKSGRGYVPYGSQGSSLGSLFGIGSIFGGGASSGGKQCTEGVCDPGDGIVTDAFPIPKIFHPSQIIQERIFREAPRAEVVITHDDDWRDVFRDDGMEETGKNLSGLQDAIFHRFQIMEKDGAAFLMPKPHATVSKDAADPLFGRIIDADNMEVEFLLNSPDTQRDPDPDDHSVSYDFSSPRDNGASDQDDKRRSKASSRSSTDTKFSPTLAPDQPPKTQGKPRKRVYVACIQCRTRRIRCDGAKPVCHNCGKRASGRTQCNYDPLPKRRGPDKTPGARKRVSQKPIGGRTRRRTSTSDAQDYIPGDSGHQMQTFAFPSPSLSEQTPEEYAVSPGIDPPFLSADVLGHAIPGPEISVPFDNSLNLLLASPLEVPVSHAFISDYEDSDDEPRRKNNSPLMTIIGQPTLDFSRKTWWDSLLSLYLSPTSERLESLSSSQRSLATQSISSDLRFLFRGSFYWFSFLHIPTFFNNLYDPAKRDLVQPSLILAALALGIFWQSSEIGIGQRGRDRALKFREEAQCALEASLNAGWVDDTLAQAAWLLAMFEICANPNHTSERPSSAMVTLDSIIRSLSLTLIDLNEPSTSTFSPGKVPAVTDAPMHMGCGPQSHNYPSSSAKPVSTDRGCSCNSLTLREQLPEALEHTPLWAQTPAWNPTWTDAEIRKESIRRLCWSSCVLAAEHSSYSSANGTHTDNLFIADPSNYALLFSGEAMVHSSSVVHPPSRKDTIWALYDRTFLLWHACIKMRNDTSAPATDKGQFAIKAWLEADAIEEALNRHTCGIERAFIFLGREFIFNTRMCITYEFQRFVPLVSVNINGLFHQHKVEEWLGHQTTVAQQIMNGLHTVTSNSSDNLSRQPFFMFWFMGKVARGLTLWQCDNSMTIALDACKTLLAPIDYLTALWPCAEQRYHYDSLRERLREACKIAGVSLPPPLNLTLPSFTLDVEV